MQRHECSQFLDFLCLLKLWFLLLYAGIFSVCAMFIPIVFKLLTSKVGIVDIQLLHLTFQELGPAFEGASVQNTLNDLESFYSGNPLQDCESGLGDRLLAGSSSYRPTTSSLRSTDALTNHFDASYNNTPPIIGGILTLEHNNINATPNFTTPMVTLGSMHEASPGTRTIAPALAPSPHPSPIVDPRLDHQLPYPRAVIHSVHPHSSTTSILRLPQQQMPWANKRPVGSSLPSNPRLPRFPPPTIFGDRSHSSRAAMPTFRTRPPSLAM